MVNQAIGVAPARVSSRQPRGARRDPAIKDAVLAATRTLLVTRGYSATSIDLIAATAKVGRPAIYRLWRSKAHLIHEAAFPDPAPASCGDDIVAEVTRMCRGALEMHADPVVREAVPGLLDDLRLQPAMRKLIDERLEDFVREVAREQSWLLFDSYGSFLPHVASATELAPCSTSSVRPQ